MKIGGMVENNYLTLYRLTSVEDKPGSAGIILKLFAESNVTLEYITESSAADGTAVMAIGVKAEMDDIIDQILQEQQNLSPSMTIKKIENVSMLGIYGPHFREKPKLAAKFCIVLGRAGVNILGLSSSISSISAIIYSVELDTAKEVLLQEFELP
jgi:aspartokinase